MSISIIVATDENRGIGKDNQLLWHISADLKYFKQVTMGKPVVMGRKTFDSIGRPLPGRRNVVISRSLHALEACEVYDDIFKAIQALANEEEVFIIGGAEIYRQTIEAADKIYLTKVFESFEADVFFPEMHANEWKQCSASEIFKDEKSGLKYQFMIFQKS